MFGLGLAEMAIILVVALIVLGPQKLPEIGRRVGLALREFRRAASDLQTNFEEVTQAPNQIHRTLTEVVETKSEPEAHQEEQQADHGDTETQRHRG